MTKVRRRPLHPEEHISQSLELLFIFSLTIFAWLIIQSR